MLLGLTSRPKQLPPKYFYDARGSALFEEITALPEYFPTRTEAALLTAHVDEIAALTGATTLVELGSGSSAKTRLLLDALTAPGRCAATSRSTSAWPRCARRSTRWPCGTRRWRCTASWATSPPPGPAAPRGRRRARRTGRRLVAFLGGTIGNLEPAQRAVFLARVRAALRPGEHLLLGAALVTDPAVLVAAYDDAAGVTAEFNRNVLHVLNRELHADLHVDAFAHVACWDAEREWIEMRLRAERRWR